jgi:hypothetical protein
MGLFKGKKPADEGGASGDTLGKPESRLQRLRWTKKREGKPDVSKTAVDPQNAPKDQEAQSLWDRAYIALEKKDPKLVKEYESLLSMEISSTSLFHLCLMSLPLTLN